MRVGPTQHGPTGTSEEEKEKAAEEEEEEEEEESLFEVEARGTPVMDIVF